MTKELAAAVTRFRSRSIDAEQEKQELDFAIADAARNGVSQVEIVRVTGLTRERVRQICQSLNGPTPEDWWDELKEDDRVAFLANRRERLTADLLNKALEANIRVAGARWASDPNSEYDFRLPPEFRSFLDAVAWWENLDEADRAAFLAARSGPLSEDLYAKAIKARVSVWRWSFDHTTGRPGRLPAAFRAFLDWRARTAELER